jgi:site-specific DNA recombinase
MDGVTSKSWTTQDGKVREGKLIDKSLIYKLLGNRTYLGELRHKEEWFKGEHQPLIEISTWEAVQSILKVSPRTRGNYTRATIPFLLKGIIEGADGRALTAAWTRKGAGKLYRYYIHTRENKEHAGASGLPRLPAIELEANVVEQLRRILRAPDLKTRVAQLLTATDNEADEAKVCIAMLQIEKVWDQLFPAEQERIVRLLIKKVVVTPHNIEVQFRPNGIERLAAEIKLPDHEKDAEEVAA